MDNQAVSDWLWLIILGGYYIISTFFLCFPNILHKRKVFQHENLQKIHSTNKIFCIGHRGAAYEFPQNTMQGFIEASKICDFIEMDVCGTQDGQLVTNHDENLIRTTGMNKPISSLNFLTKQQKQEKEKKGKCKKYQNCLPKFLLQYQSYFKNQTLTSNQNKIPRLQDIFIAFPDTPMLIELKTPQLKQLQNKKIVGYDWPIQELNRLIRKYQREEYTIWGTEKAHLNIRMHQMNPKVTTFYSQNEIIRVIILFFLGFLPFSCIRPGCIILPYMSKITKKELDQISGLKKLKRHLGYLFVNFIARFFVGHLNDRGILTFFHTLNQDSEFQGALSIGAKGIITDRPSKLKLFLNEKHLFLKKKNDKAKEEKKKDKEEKKKDKEQYKNLNRPLIPQ